MAATSNTRYLAHYINNKAEFIPMLALKHEIEAARDVFTLYVINFRSLAPTYRIELGCILIFLILTIMYTHTCVDNNSCCLDRL